MTDIYDGKAFKHDAIAHDKGFSGFPALNPYSESEEWDEWASYQAGQDAATEYNNSMDY